MCRQDLPRSGKETIDYLQGHIDNGNKSWALKSLGDCYYYGTLGVKQSYGEAFRYYSLAVEQGDVDSQFYLALMYNKKLGVVQSYTEAFRFYASAAHEGDAEAQCS